MDEYHFNTSQNWGEGEKKEQSGTPTAMEKEK